MVSKNLIVPMTLSSVALIWPGCRSQIETDLRSNQAAIQTGVQTEPDPVTNLPPTAAAERLAGEEDQIVTFTLKGADEDGDVLTFAVVTQPEHGTVSITDPHAGTGTYKPKTNFFGTDEFAFSVSDGKATSSAVPVILTIAAIDDAPEASALTLLAKETAPTSGTLDATDAESQAVTYVLVTQPDQGQVVLNDPATGAYTFTPDVGASGTDSFTFKATAGGKDSNAAAVTITFSMAPRLTALIPDGGDAVGGLAVTLSGTDFAAGMTVMIGDAPCANVVVGSGTEATCTVPARDVGMHDVAIANADGQQGLLSDGYGAYRTYMYVQNSGSDNLSGFALDSNSGAVTEIAGSPFASVGGGRWAAVHPTQKFVYTADSVGDKINGFSVDFVTGALTPLAGSPWTAVAGSNPGPVVIDPSGAYMYTVGGWPGTFSNFSIDAVTGALTANDSATVPGLHPHGLAIHPTGKCLFTGHFHGAQVDSYTLDATDGKITSVMAYNTLEGATPVKNHEVVVHPSGKFVYAAGTTSSVVMAYTVDQTTCALTAITPNVNAGNHVGLTVDPEGRFLFVSDLTTSRVRAFDIDQTTGALTERALTGFGPAGTTPWGLTFDPSGRFLAVANYGSNNVTLFEYHKATGELTLLATQAVGLGPYQVAFLLAE